MKRPDKTTPSQNGKATPPSQSNETDSRQSEYILKSFRLTPQEWQACMKRLCKEGRAEEVLQIVRISIPLSQNYTPEERTEASHFFANELMKLAREGKVIKPPILSPDFTKKQILPQLAALEARHPGFSKLWKEGRLNDFPSHTAGELLRLIHLDWNAFVALKEWSECLADEPEREDERDISVESGLTKKLLYGDPNIVTRRAIIVQNPKMSAKDLCGRFDLQKIPLPETWLEDFKVEDWRAAYQHPRCRSRVDSLISKDRRKI